MIKQEVINVSLVLETSTIAYLIEAIDAHRRELFNQIESTQSDSRLCASTRRERLNKLTQKNEKLKQIDIYLKTSLYD